MREKLHNFFAKHDSTGGGLRWHPAHASPGIDDPGFAYGVQRSFAGILKTPPQAIATPKPVARVVTLGNHSAIVAVR